MIKNSITPKNKMGSLHKNQKFKTCTHCKNEVSVKNFASHLRIHLPEDDRTRFKCTVDQCSKIYCSQSALNQHVRDLHSSTPRIKLKFKCNLCSNNYSSKACLKRHIRQIHSKSFTKYGCSLCDAEFKSKGGRDYHVKAFPCELCPAKFPTAGQLKSHQFVHSDEWPHKCSTCSRQFKQKICLTQHVSNLHSQRTKDFACSTCQKSFHTKYKLSRHVKSHAVRGEFACYFCKKEFAQRHHLGEHLNTHTLEKPYFCPEKFCQFSAAQPNSLRQHKIRYHSLHGDEATTTPSKIWTCYFCSRTFARFSNLLIHMRSHTLEEPFPCNLCKKSFRDGYHLERHIPSHTKEKPFSCPHCGKCFAQNHKLTRHLGIHTL